MESNKKLTKLVNLFSEKYSTTIVTTSKKYNWKLNFPVPLILKPEFEYQIGMMYFNVYNTVYNIDQNNNSFSFCKNDTMVDNPLNKLIYLCDDLNLHKIPQGARELKISIYVFKIYLEKTAKE